MSGLNLGFGWETIIVPSLTRMFTPAKELITKLVFTLTSAVGMSQIIIRHDVTAIIGILASLLLPTLIRSKAIAKRIHCVGNVRQMALVAPLYTDDYEDRLPLGWMLLAG